MFEKLEAFVGTKLARGFVTVALVAFAYWLGAHTTQEKADAVNTAVTSVTGQVNKILTDNINTQVSGINARLLGDTNAINLILKGGLQTVDDADARLRSLPHAGVYVKAGPGPTREAAAPGAAAAGPGNHETYRAELSEQTRDFFASEAKRANECAVRLTSAQSTLLSWQRAVDEYNRTIANAENYKPLALPAPVPVKVK